MIRGMSHWKYNPNIYGRYDAQGQGFKRLSRNKLKYLFMLSMAHTGATANQKQQ